MLVFAPNLLDQGAVLTASTQDVNWPVGNLQDQRMAKVWRTLGTQATESVIIDLGSALTVSSFLVAGHTLDGTDSAVAIQANATNSWSSPSFNAALTVMPGKNFGLSSLGAVGGPFRYWRFVFTKTSAATIRQVGRLHIGVSVDTGIPVDYSGLVKQPVDLSTVVQSIGGQDYTETKPHYETFSLPFSYMPDANQALLRALLASNGTATPFFIQISTTSPLDVYYYARFTKMPAQKLVAWDGSYIWSDVVDLKELL